VQHLNKAKTPIHADVIYLQGTRDGVDIEIALQWNEGYAENVYAFANNINTIEGGTHLSGFRSALTRTINAYAVANGVLKKDEEALQGEDVREGLTAVVSVKVPEPQFEGQTKTKLGNSEVKGTVEALVNDRLALFLEEHPPEARRIVMKGLEAARVREATRKAKDLARRKGALDGGCSRQARRLSGARPALGALHRRGDWPAARPSRGATVATRRSCRCGARS
jgi:DNA gyrase subunit B